MFKDSAGIAFTEFVARLRVEKARHLLQNPDLQTKTDKMIRLAAERLMSRLLGTSLHLDSAAVKHRFGFAA